MKHRIIDTPVGPVTLVVDDDGVLCGSYLAGQRHHPDPATFGERSDGPTEALYFVFRTRDTARLGELPRATSLQRAVLERFERGETWQTARGYLVLPPGDSRR